MIAVCPFCGSDDIDFENRTCRACGTGLPLGSFDTRPRFRTGRASTRAARLAHGADKVDRHMHGAK